jgi:hypothetical protein
LAENGLAQGRSEQIVYSWQMCPDVREASVPTPPWATAVEQSGYCGGAL